MTDRTDPVLTLQDGRTVRGHRLKTYSEFFDRLADRSKTFEIRHNDRDFRVGDYLELVDYDRAARELTGRKLFRRVTYLTAWNQIGDHVVLGLEVLRRDEAFDSRPIEAGDFVRWENPDQSGNQEWLVVAAGDEIALLAMEDGGVGRLEEEVPISELVRLLPTDGGHFLPEAELQGAQVRLEALEAFVRDLVLFTASPGVEEDTAAHVLRGDLEETLPEFLEHLRDVIDAPTGVNQAAVDDMAIRSAHADGYAAGMDHDRDKLFEREEEAAWEDRVANSASQGAQPYDGEPLGKLFEGSPAKLDPSFTATDFQAAFAKLDPIFRIPGGPALGRIDGVRVTSAVESFLGIPLVVDESLPPGTIRFAHPDGRSDVFLVGSDELRGPLAAEEFELLRSGHDLPSEAKVDEAIRELQAAHGRTRTVRLLDPPNQELRDLAVLVDYFRIEGESLAGGGVWDDEVQAVLDRWTPVLLRDDLELASPEHGARYRAPDGVEGVLSVGKACFGSPLSFMPDGAKAPAVIGPGFPDPRRYLRRESDDEILDFRRYVLVEGAPRGD